VIDYIPGLAGVPATESAISSIDGKNGILAYRGYSIEDLVENTTFEETAMLLLLGELPNKSAIDEFQKTLQKHYRVKYNIRNMMWALPPTGHPMNVLQGAIASMAPFYPESKKAAFETSEAQNALIHILSKMATLVAMWEHVRNGYDPVEPDPTLGYAKNFLYMLSGKEPSDELVKLFDACLILHAEHTINASTFSTMVTASTLTNPFAAISAAVGTLAGPLHGGANEDVLKMLDEIGEPSKAREYIEKRLEKKQVIWGMGHREYSVKDPRATILQRMIEDYVNKTGLKLSKRFETALEVERICEELLSKKGVFPNVDFYSGILYSEILKLPTDQFTPIFAVARSAGWLAHWEEQIEHNRIFRPTQIYTGSNFRKFPKL
jgi:citrate synthase